MSTSFFIGPIDPTSWYTEESSDQKPTSDLMIDPNLYRVELMKRWPFADIGEGGEHYALFWKLDTEAGLGPEGGLQSDLQHVSFRYSDLTFVDFVLWHRRFVPSQYVLYLFNSSSAPRHLVLHSEVTVGDVELYLSSS